MNPKNSNIKVGQSLLGSAEQRMIQWIVPRLPAWLRSDHLTLCSLPISVGIVLTSYAARDDRSWLWLVSLFIFLQWMTDSLDGAVGRYRKEGLVRWGFYMDHFLDFVFLSAVVIGYALLLTPYFHLLMLLIFAIFGAFMVHAYLAFGATGEFRISFHGIGPTEVRVMFIFINILLAVYGTTHLARALPILLILATLGLCRVVYDTQRRLRARDLEEKEL